MTKQKVKLESLKQEATKKRQHPLQDTSSVMTIPAVPGLREVDVTTRSAEVVQDDDVSELGTVAAVVDDTDGGLLQFPKQLLGSLQVLYDSLSSWKKSYLTGLSVDLNTS